MATDVRVPEFRERFAQLRIGQNMTQAQFADFLGISRPTVGFYENGDRIPDAEILKKICEKCGVTADWLLGLSDVSTTNAELKDVCDYIGFSEKAVKRWHAYQLVSKIPLDEFDKMEIADLRDQFGMSLTPGIFDTPTVALEKLRAVSLFLENDAPKIFEAICELKSLMKERIEKADEMEQHVNHPRTKDWGTLSELNNDTPDVMEFRINRDFAAFVQKTYRVEKERLEGILPKLEEATYYNKLRSSINANDPETK